MSTTRRNFLKSTGLGIGSLALPMAGMQPVFGQGIAPKTLVNVFLRGGADGLYFCPPLANPGSDEGLKIVTDFRPNLFSPEGLFWVDSDKGASISNPVALAGEPLDGYFVLHPQMSKFKAMYDTGTLAIVHGVGGAGNHSHFVAMDAVENAKPDGLGPPGLNGTERASTTTDNGWLHDSVVRIPVANPTSMRAVAIGAAKPQAMAGIANHGLISAIPSVASGFDVPGSPEFKTMLRDLFLPDPSSSPPNLGIRQSVTRALDVESKLNTLQSLNYSIGSHYSDPVLASHGSFVNSLRNAVRLIKSGYGVGIINIDIDGWDTHDEQVERLWTLTKVLSEGLYAFYQDLADDSDGSPAVSYSDVCTLVMSEFGRTLDHKSPETTGTDHGDGGVAFVIGGGVNGGSVYADTQNVTGHWKSADMIAARNNRYYWPVTIEYRSVFDSILSGFFDLDTTDILSILGVVETPLSGGSWPSPLPVATGLYTGPVVPSLF